MKKLLISISTLILLLISVPIIGSAVTRSDNPDSDLAQQWDRFNLLIPKEAIYVKTANRYGTIREHGDYVYRQEAYRADGTHYPIVFQAPKQLKENYYLKLEAKGRFIKTWEAVPNKDLPIKLQTIFNAQ